MLVILVFVLKIVLVIGNYEPLLEQSFLYGVSYLANERNVSSTCQNDLTVLYKSINNNEFWSLKVLDASGTPETGFYYGNNLWLGSYAQCEDLSNTKKFEVNYDKVLHPNSTGHDYPPYKLGFFVAHLEHNSIAQYHSQLPLEFILQVGFCGPDSCSTEELDLYFNTFIERKYLSFQKVNNISLTVSLIRKVEPLGLWIFYLPQTMILILLALIIIILSITGTYLDLRIQRNKEKIEKLSKPNLKEDDFSENVFSSFSIYKNIKNFVKTDLSADSIAPIHGLKFFGMLWVIMVHSVFYQSDYLENAAVAYRLSENIFSQILSNSTYCVDTYLFLSGFLLAYLFFANRKNNMNLQNSNCITKKIMQFFLMFFNRFLRLTPPYIIIILLANVMYSYYNQSSVLYFSERNDITCIKYWWRNILYINNLYPRSEMCLSWSWYLSVDTQFFAVGSLLLILSTIHFKISAITTVLLIVISTLATTYASYSIKYIPTMDEQLTKLDAIYDLPWNRIGPYLIGIITAYIYVVKLERKLKLTKPIRILLWILFPLLNLWILFTLYTRNLSVEFSAIYMGLSRTLWAIGIAWVLIACCTGNAGILTTFLSFPGWIPLSRLTYCAYLLNPLIANMIYLGSNSSLNASKAFFGVTAQGVAMSTYFLAFFFCVLIESPSIILTKLTFKRLLSKNNGQSKA